jgi:hypothetical protein
MRAFSRVLAAREILKERMAEIVEAYLASARAADEKGQHDVAIEAYQWLIEHSPAGEDGSRVIDESAAKPKPVAPLSTPSINIGFALGGISASKALPEAPVIDVLPEPEKSHE